MAKRINSWWHDAVARDHTWPYETRLIWPEAHSTWNDSEPEVQNQEINQNLVTSDAMQTFLGNCKRCYIRVTVAESYRLVMKGYSYICYYCKIKLEANSSKNPKRKKLCIGGKSCLITWTLHVILCLKKKNHINGTLSEWYTFIHKHRQAVWRIYNWKSQNISSFLHLVSRCYHSQLPSCVHSTI